MHIVPLTAHRQIVAPESQLMNRKRGRWLYRRDRVRSELDKTIRRL